jgi:hypothetical protein
VKLHAACETARSARNSEICMDRRVSRDRADQCDPKLEQDGCRTKRLVAHSAASTGERWADANAGRVAQVCL